MIFTNTSSDTPPPDWQAKYKAAMLEADSSKLQERIGLARNAITERIKGLGELHLGTHEERQAIIDALNNPAMLEREFQKSRGQAEVIGHKKEPSGSDRNDRVMELYKLHMLAHPPELPNGPAT